MQAIHNIDNREYQQNNLANTSSTGAGFADVMSAAANTDTSGTSNSTKSPAEGKARFTSGRIGLECSNDVPTMVKYFDKDGGLLTTSTFNAESILKYTKEFGIDLKDLKGIGEQLDAEGIGYRPYELYAGTGSDHGINFDDVIKGGMGTAYDWTKDKNVGLKGETGAASLKAAQDLAQNLGVQKNPEVTTGGGIRPENISAYTNSEGNRGTVTYTNDSVAWFQNASDAQQYAAQNGGTVLDVSKTTPWGSPVTAPQNGTSTAPPPPAVAAAAAQQHSSQDATSSANKEQKLSSSEEFLRMQNNLNALSSKYGTSHPLLQGLLNLGS